VFERVLALIFSRFVDTFHPVRWLRCASAAGQAGRLPAWPGRARAARRRRRYCASKAGADQLHARACAWSCTAAAFGGDDRTAFIDNSDDRRQSYPMPLLIRPILPRAWLFKAILRCDAYQSSVADGVAARRATRTSDSRVRSDHARTRAQTAHRIQRLVPGCWHTAAASSSARPHRPIMR